MTQYTTLFPEKYITSRLKPAAFELEDQAQKLSVIGRWKHEIDSKSIYTKKEEQLQADFLNDIFGKVLGYAYERGLDEINLEKEFKSKTDGTKPDGVLGYLTTENKDIRVVIELKDAYTNLDHKQNRKNDNRTPVEQAFSYVSKCGGKCKWVIVSNFVEIRLYPANDSSVYQSFSVADLIKEEKLKEFHALLAKDNLFIPTGESKIDELLKLKIEADETITKEFYNVYKTLRSQLFKHIKENNPAVDESIILTKSQKILDRIIFICFCEDLGLLPYKVFKEILHQTQTARFIMTDTRLWEEIKGLFTAIDQGYPQENINRFNGGLFKADDVIDNLVIRDGILKEILSIERYSFDSDLNVNILGHIFEQSITDLEELKSAINGEDFDKKKGKRKKDGVFYTPEYITKYIVNEAVGSWLEDKKKELGYYELPKIDDEQWRRIKTGKVQKSNKTINAHLNFWLEYRKALDNIKVLDPACGSGSFLVQVFDYLKEQRNQVNDEIATFEGTQAELFNQDTHILSHNIYGVDLNPESVEITKLALWLKTANKKDPLTALDDNIKCGNSLIDDVAVAGDKAFDWNKEFSDIMANGGFDVVVGNPPYGAKLNKEEVNFIANNSKKWGISANLNDTYFIFYALGLDKLLLNNGYLGYITPNTWKLIEKAILFRKHITSENFRIKQVVQHLNKVFDDAVVDCDTMIIKKTKSNSQSLINISFMNEGVIKKEHNLLQDTLHHQYYYNFFLTEEDYSLRNKILKNSALLKDKFEIKNGIKPYEVGKGTPPQSRDTLKIKPFTSEYKCDDTFLPLIGGSLFHKYRLLWANNSWIKYGEWLAAPRDKQIFECDEKLIFRQTSDTLIGMLVGKDFIMRNNTHIILKRNDELNLKYILACLNSKLINYFYWTINPEKNEAMAEVKAFHLGLMPIKLISKKQQQPFIDLVDIMLDKNKELQDLSTKFMDLLKGDFTAINTPLQSWYDLDWNDFVNALKKQKIALTGTLKEDWYDRFNRLSTKAKTIKSTIDTTDKQIDSLVYQLYGLTDEEIKVVENG